MSSSNVLVRFLVRDDRQQAKSAVKHIRKATAGDGLCFINLIVFCELVWVLESAYGYSKLEIADVLEKILATTPKSAWMKASGGP